MTGSVAVALDDDLVCVVCESVDGALSKDGVIEEGDPFFDGAVGSEDGGASAVSFEDDLVEVAGLLGIESAQREVVQEEEVGSEKASQEPFGGVVGSGLV